VDFTFLICSERSGSNLITKLLDSHSDYAGPAPSHLIRTLALNILRYGDLSKNENWQSLTNDAADLLVNRVGSWQTKWTGAKLRAEVKERSQTALIKHVYKSETIACAKNNVFIKENHTHRFMPFLINNFPNSRYIWMTRDPRDMALSWKKNNIIKTGIIDAAKVWQNDQSKMLIQYSYLKAQKQILLLTYEDLVTNPEKECKRICNHLGITYDENMLTFYKKPEVQAMASETDAWKNLKNSVMSKNFGKYRTELNETEIRYVESVCYEEMGTYGYKAEYKRGQDEKLASLLLTPTRSSKGIVSSLEKKIRDKRLKTIQRILARPISL
jgi:hypothetical protein